MKLRTKAVILPIISFLIVAMIIGGCKQRAIPTLDRGDRDDCGEESGDSVKVWYVGADGPDDNPCAVKATRIGETLIISGNGAMAGAQTEGWSPFFERYSGEERPTDVVIENGVTHIDTWAFKGLSKLKTVTIPASVSFIDEGLLCWNVDWSFRNLTSITVAVDNARYGSEDGVLFAKDQKNKNVTVVTYPGNKQQSAYTIPNGVTSIGGKVFGDSKHLKAVAIPNSVTSIDNEAFDDFPGLTSVTVAAGNARYSSNDGVLFNKAGDTLILYPRNKRQDTYTIPQGVTSIGNRAFDGCAGLKSVVIPNGVVSIGKAAFRNCTGLKSVIIPNSVSSIGKAAFSGCTSLKSVIIPNSLTSIGHEAFYECTGLKSVIIPNSVVSIGEDAFNGCDGLKSVVIPNSVVSIGRNAFDDCTGLQSVIIPNSVDSIGYNAFNGCDGLKSVVIPGSVVSIGVGAFNECGGLVSIDVMPDNADYSSVGGVLFNKDKTVLIQYPGGRQGAYTVPKGVTSIGTDAFQGCTGLRSVAVPNGVTSIGSRAFQGCTGLKSIAIPKGVVSIGDNAFKGCTGLKSVIIPNSVDSIGNHVFCDCMSLTTINSSNPVPPVIDGKSIFCLPIYGETEVPNACLYVPESGVYAYRADYMWGVITCIRAITEVGGDARLSLSKRKD